MWSCFLTLKINKQLTVPSFSANLTIKKAATTFTDVISSMWEFWIQLSTMAVTTEAEDVSRLQTERWWKVLPDLSLANLGFNNREDAWKGPLCSCTNQKSTLVTLLCQLCYHLYSNKHKGLNVFLLLFSNSDLLLMPTTSLLGQYYSLKALRLHNQRQ